MADRCPTKYLYCFKLYAICPSALARCRMCRAAVTSSWYGMTEGENTMTFSTSPLASAQLIDCIGADRDPTVGELFLQAELMWIDGASGRSTFAWGQLAPGSGERLMALRGAQLALIGNGDDRRGSSLWSFPRGAV